MFQEQLFCLLFPARNIKWFLFFFPVKVHLRILIHVSTIYVSVRIDRHFRPLLRHCYTELFPCSPELQRGRNILAIVCYYVERNTSLEHSDGGGGGGGELHYLKQILF